MKKIIINLDNDHDPYETACKVAELLEEGYTSGISPTWEIVEE